MVTSQILRGDKMLNIPTRKLYLHCSLYNLWRVDNTWGEVKGKVCQIFFWGGDPVACIDMRSSFSGIILYLLFFKNFVKKTIFNPLTPREKKFSNQPEIFTSF